MFGSNTRLLFPSTEQIHDKVTANADKDDAGKCALFLLEMGLRTSELLDGLSRTRMYRTMHKKIWPMKHMQGQAEYKGLLY